MTSAFDTGFHRTICFGTLERLSDALEKSRAEERKISKKRGKYRWTPEIAKRLS